MENLSNTHRQMGIDLFNEVWTYLDKAERTREENDRMIHTAHASRYHWEKSGCPPANLARGEWQVSRVYAVLQRPEPAFYHAQNCLDICLENKIGDWDLAFAYEALARACALTGNNIETARYLSLAQEASQNIKDKEDRDLLLGDLATIVY